MARTSQIAGFATRAPSARPIVLSGRSANGGGRRTTVTSGLRPPVIQGTVRAVKAKGGRG